jgi:hemolysin activation/secretion protein
MRGLRRLVVAFASVSSLLAMSAACAQEGPTARAEASEPSFDILEFLVEGNTVLAADDIERAVYPFLGPGRVFGDVEAARKALEARYRSQGFGFASVDIPEQRADTGVIRLVVYEGAIERTRVIGAKFYSQGFILSRVMAGAEGTVPNLLSLQAQLAEVNRNGDRKVSPVLRPGRERGATELDLVVEDKLPFHGSLTLNNQAGPNTSATRLQATLSYDNLFQRDHSLSLQAVTSPQRQQEVKVASISYTVPLGPAGLESLSATFTRSDSEVVAGLAGTTLFGKGSIWGLRRSFVLGLSDTDFHLATLGLDYKDFQETVAAGDGAGFRTPISYLPFTASWTGAYRTGAQDLVLGLSISGGFRDIVNRQDQFANKRFEAKASYMLLRMEAQSTSVLPWWGLRLRARVDAQLTPDPLISNEQFVLGGAASVRGYREAEAAADAGVRGSVQLGSQDLSSWVGLKWLGAFNVYGYVDGALGFLHKPLPEQSNRFRLLGVGLGLQASTKGALPISLSLDLGEPVLRRDAIGSQGFRVHASASVGF